MTSCATTFVAQALPGQPIAGEGGAGCGARSCPATGAGDGGGGGGAPDSGFFCTTLDVLPIPSADNPYVQGGFLPPCTGICADDLCPGYI
jgi:hypothetical protein